MKQVVCLQVYYSTVESSTAKRRILLFGQAEWPVRLLLAAAFSLSFLLGVCCCLVFLWCGGALSFTPLGWCSFLFPWVCAARFPPFLGGVFLVPLG